MICATCHGNTSLPIKRDGRRIGVRVCPDCLGGIASCCDGLVPQTVCSDEPQAQNTESYPTTTVAAEAGEP